MCSGRSSKGAVYFEYCYKVEGVPYCKSYFYEDDKKDKSKLPTAIKMYYNKKKPTMVFREGETRDGVILSVVLLILGVPLLVASIVSIW